MELTLADTWELFSWAILASLLAGVVCPLIGCFLLVRRTGFYGIALPQFATTGVAAGYAILPWWLANIGLAGLDLHGALESPHALDTYLLAWAGVFTFGGLFALSIPGPSSSTEAGRVAAAFAISGALTVLFGQLSPSGMERVEVLLRGEVLVVGVHEFEVMALAYGIVLVLFVVYHRDLLLVSYDRDTASVLGKSVRGYGLLLTLLVGLTVSTGVIILGPMVLFGTLVVPPLAARTWAASMTSFYCVASGIGLVSATLGLWASFGFDWPLGPSIVAVAGLVWLAAVIVGRLRRSGGDSEGDVGAEVQVVLSSQPARQLERVRFRRSGGIHPLGVRTEIELSAESSDEAQRICELVGSSGLMDPEYSAPPVRRMPDAYVYTVVVVIGAEERSFQFTDPSVPAEVVPLIRYMTARAEA